MALRQDNRTGIYFKEFYVRVNGELRQRRISLDTKIKKEALQRYGQEKGKGDYNSTFNELLGEYQKEFQGQKSFQDKKRHFRFLLNVFDGMKLKDITPLHLRKLRNERKATLVKKGVEKIKEGYKIRELNPKPRRERKDATVNREMNTLRHMLSMAIEWEMLETSPFAKTKRLFYKENNARLRFLTEVEEVRLMKQIKKNIIKNMVTVAINTGMRKGEILSLTWAQIKTVKQDDLIYLTRTKTETARQIPINDTLRSLFTSLPRHITSDYVFHKHNGTRYRDIGKTFARAVEKAGINDFHFHDLRHTFASRLVMRGVGLQAVKELLGHKDFKMTLRYAHLEAKYLVDAVKVLDRKPEDQEENKEHQEKSKEHLKSILPISGDQLETPPLQVAEL